MTSVKRNTNSYDCGNTPHEHDIQRGKWSSKWDFYLASFGHAFGLKNITILPMIFLYLGTYGLLPCILGIFLTSVPIYLVQSTLGQFSSTGFLSVFRISPMFKGIGYVILILNFTSVTFYTVFASYSLTYFFRSLSSELPWMTCDNWWNTEKCEIPFNKSMLGNSQNMSKILYDISDDNSAPVQYLIRNIFGVSSLNDSENVISLSIVGTNFVVWICVCLCIFKGIESVSKASRYTISFAIGLFVILLIRFLCLPGAFEGIAVHMTPLWMVPYDPWFWIVSPIFILMSLGNGWGTILTMASYNHFKTDVVKYSLIIPFGIFVLTLLAVILVFAGYGYLLTGGRVIPLLAGQEFSLSFAILPYIFGLMEASSFWSSIFYLMIFLFELNAITIQVFSILTAVFDEYVSMRPYKQYISIGTCAVLFVLSIFFASESGYLSFRALLAAAGAHQILICLFELLIVLWIYGRQRFQRDFKFMVGRTIYAWQFFIIRFTTPIFCLLILMFYIYMTYYYLEISFVISIILILLMKTLPWVIVPSYMVYKIYSTVGTLLKRLQRCAQPTDWYPADAADRHEYENSFGLSDTSHQLINDKINNKLGA